MFTKCQDFYTLGVEIKFKKEVGILTWRVSDCEDLVGEVNYCKKSCII